MTEIWKRIVAVIAARDSNARCTDEGARFAWPTSDREPIRIVLMPSDVVATPCVTIVAWIGEAAGFDANDLLDHSGAILEGAVMLRDGVFLFRVTVPCAQLDETALAQWLDYTANQTAMLSGHRKRLALVRPDAFGWAL